MAARRTTVEQVARFVYEHPEPAHAEDECAAYLAGVLEHGGFTVERGVGGMDTAFRASIAGTSEGPSIAMVAVYDAVTAPGSDGVRSVTHSCGHGSVAGGVVGAALALADCRDRLPGRVMVMGLPADELHADACRTRGGGKALSVARALWTGVDVALYAHPELIDTVSQSSLWGRQISMDVVGHRSLRPDRPQRVLAALSALSSAVASSASPASSASCSSSASSPSSASFGPDEVLLEELVFDGDVEEGAFMALRASFLLLASSKERLNDLSKGLREAVAGARWTVRRDIPAIAPDDRVTAAVAAAMQWLGREFVADPPPLPFATDFGPISRAVPSALIGVGRPEGWTFHTEEGAAQFTSPAGTDAAFSIAEVLALSVLSLVGAGLF